MVAAARNANSGWLVDQGGGNPEGGRSAFVATCLLCGWDEVCGVAWESLMLSGSFPQARLKFGSHTSEALVSSCTCLRVLRVHGSACLCFILHL